MALRVVETSLVAPAGPTLPPRSVALTFFDVKWLHLPPVERVFFYRLSSPEEAEEVVAGLKASLAEALRAFYPLAGRVRCVVPAPSDNGNGAANNSTRHELCYRPGDAVPFTTAEYEGVDMEELASDDPVAVPLLAPLVPQLPKGRGVLAVQATTMSSSRSSKGLAVGVTVHHSACDGAGSTNFLHAWASKKAVPPPALDRALLIPDPRGLYGIYLKSLPPVITDDAAFEFVTKPPASFQDKLLATFTLPKSLLESIKAAVAGEAERRGIAPPPRCSTMLAAYAFMWSCYCRAALHVDLRSPKTSLFLFSVDQRARGLIHPPVPPTYLGNCLCPAIAAAPEDHLAAPGIAGLFAACAAVAAALQEQLRDDAWDTCVDRVKQGAAQGMLSVAGSPRFRVYDLDFGFGRPAKVAMVSAAKSGAMPLAEARRLLLAGGGVEVGVSLPPRGMDTFRKTFADAVAWLSPLSA